MALPYLSLRQKLFMFIMNFASSETNGLRPLSTEDSWNFFSLTDLLLKELQKLVHSKSLLLHKNFLNSLRKLRIAI